MWVESSPTAKRLRREAQKAKEGLKRAMSTPVLGDEEEDKKRKAQLLDDVPITIKRTRCQDEPSGVEHLPAVATNAAAKLKRNS